MTALKLADPYRGMENSRARAEGDEPTSCSECKHAKGNGHATRCHERTIVSVAGRSIHGHVRVYEISRAEPELRSAIRSGNCARFSRRLSWWRRIVRRVLG